MTNDDPARDDRGNADDPQRRDSADTSNSTDVTAGKGRRDEVGRSGVYPPGVDAPDDAEVITPGEFGHRK